MWQGKRVVVTGGAGMVGHHLCSRLLGAGAEVAVLDNLSGDYTAPKGVELIVGDAGDVEVCHQAFDGAYAVFNLAAAVGGLYHNMANQATQFTLNMRLMESPAVAAEGLVEKFLQVSTVCVYSDRYNSPAREEFGFMRSPEGGNAGYAWAKRMGELVAGWSFNKTEYFVVRPTNMFGEWDHYGERAHVIPALIRKFSTQDEVMVFGRTQRREFLHADDGAKAMMHVMEHGEGGEVYNLGTHGVTCIAIGDLAQFIRLLCKSDASIIFDTEVPTGDKDRWTDSSKLMRLGWKWSVGLLDGLERAIEWYRYTSQETRNPFEVVGAEA